MMEDRQGNIPGILNETDYQDMRDGEVVIYAVMEKNGFLTFARTTMNRDNFLNKAHTQKTGPIIMDKLRRCIGY